MELPQKGFMCGECLAVQPTWNVAERCCKARLLGHPIWDLSVEGDRQVAMAASND
jgi:hypothetical protein